VKLLDLNSPKENELVTYVFSELDRFTAGLGVELEKTTKLPRQKLIAILGTVHLTKGYYLTEKALGKGRSKEIFEKLCAEIEKSR
jgi:hypothetical protein